MATERAGTPVESEADFSETSESRPKRPRKQPRYPTASSTTSSRAASPKPTLPVLSIAQNTVSSRRSGDTDQTHPPGAYVSYLRASSSSQATPTTPGLSISTGTGSVIEESDSDFQSAYSESPRGSDGSFEQSQIQSEIDDGLVSDTASQATAELVHHFEGSKGGPEHRAPPPVFRKAKQHVRISSGASVESYTQPSPSASDYTVVTQN